MPTSNELSPRQLREAIKLSGQIQRLRERLQAILGSGGKGSAPTTASKTKHTMSPEGRERIAAAQRARWAKLKSPAKKSAAAKSAAAK